MTVQRADARHRVHAGVEDGSGGRAAGEAQVAVELSRLTADARQRLA